MRTVTNPDHDINAYDSFFLHQGEEGINAFKENIELVSKNLEELFSGADSPFTGKRPEDIKCEIEPLIRLTEEAHSLEEVLRAIKEPILKNSLNISHKKSMAHLHCPPLLPGILAELIIGALNQSMDSWDQSTAATYVEQELIKKITKMAQLPETADGIFSSGGTQSNYMGLLLARDHFCHTHWRQNVKKHGLPDGFSRLRIICSEDAHFTVKKSASQLGLGENSIITIRTDSNNRMPVKDVRRILIKLKADNLLPFVLVATCGTTDFGGIDPLNELAEVARDYNMWFHIDAAFGGGLLFSHSYSEKLNGLDKADSITIDFHKLFYQPISCGVFLVANQRYFRYLTYHADYLNTVQDKADGIVNLVDKSIQTTRRFDALKFLLTIKTVGTRILGNMIDYTLELAKETAGYLMEHESFYVLNNEPELNTVIFQFKPKVSPHMKISDINRLIQQELLFRGKAAVAKTSIDGNTYLKFTLLNPRTTLQDVKLVIHDIEKIGNQLIRNRG